MVVCAARGRGAHLQKCSTKVPKACCVSYRSSQSRRAVVCSWHVILGWLPKLLPQQERIKVTSPMVRPTQNSLIEGHWGQMSRLGGDGVADTDGVVVPLRNLINLSKAYTHTSTVSSTMSALTHLYSKSSTSTQWASSAPLGRWALIEVAAG